MSGPTTIVRHEFSTAWGARRVVPHSFPSEGAEDVLDAGLGVAEEHVAVLAEEQRVLHAGVAGGHGALEDDDVVRLPDPQHRHAGDGAGRVVLGGRVDRVVGADHEHDRGAGEVVVDLVHLEDDVVGHLRLGEQHVHVPGQATGDRVDAEAHLDAALAQLTGEVGDRVLGLGDRHAVAGGDDHRVGVEQQLGASAAVISRCSP